MIEVRIEPTAIRTPYDQDMVEVVVESPEGDHTWGIFHPETANAEANALRQMFAVVQAPPLRQPVPEPELDTVLPNGDVVSARLPTGTLQEDVGCPHCGKLCDSCVDFDEQEAGIRRRLQIALGRPHENDILNLLAELERRVGHRR